MQNVRACTLRGQFELAKVANPIDIEEVEPAKEIVKRFATGNFSFIYLLLPFPFLFTKYFIL